MGFFFAAALAKADQNYGARTQVTLGFSGQSMSSEKNKKSFAWEKGNVIAEDEYAPLGEVNKKGRPKLAHAVHANPVLRKKERDAVLTEQQSKPYRVPPKKEKEDSLIVEASQSGLSDSVESSVAKKLIESGNKFKGLGRFGKRK